MTGKQRVLTLAAVMLVAAVVCTWSLLADREAAPAPASAGGEIVPRGAAPADEHAGEAPIPIRPVRVSETDPDVALSEANEVRIRGRILDAEGGALADAMVGGVSSARPAITAADGSFSVLAERSGQGITLLVLAAGYAPGLPMLDVDPAAREHDAGDLRLLRGGGIRGRITAPAGAGLSGATATLVPAAGESWPRSLELADLLTPETSDPDGSFRFANLRPGRYVVTATAAGMQTARSAVTTVRDGVISDVAPLALAVGHDLAGLVIGPNDVPVAGASVKIRSGVNQPRYAVQAETKEDGGFHTSGLPSGPLRIDVTRPGFLSFSRSDVDPTLAQKLVIRLEAGLRITGTAIDSRTGRPLEKFGASLRRVGVLDPDNGTVGEQIRRQLDSARAAAASAADPESRKALLRIVSDFEARRERVGRHRGSSPVMAPADAGPIVDRPGGRFSFEGLEDGVYAVGIISPAHAFAESGPIEVGRGMPAPDVRIEVGEGCSLSGIVVSKHDRKPITGATVELVRVLEAAPGTAEEAGSPYEWVFDDRGPRGVTVLATKTGTDGRFGFGQVAPGRCLLSVRHAGSVDHDTGAFDVQAGMEDVRVEIGAGASLSGQVHQVPQGQENAVKIVLVGGHGTMQTAQAAANGRYSFQGLQPGRYVVRAFLAGDANYVKRLFGSVFPRDAGAVDGSKAGRVILSEGEAAVLDVVLDTPPTGVVEGTVSINGQPDRGCRVIVRPVPGEAPDAGGLTLSGACDERGRFTVRDVPAGTYTLLVFGPTRQELDRKVVTVASGATAAVQVDVESGGLRGRVLAPDAASAEEIAGSLWVLPGAAEAPEDLYQHQQMHRTHRIRVRNGTFEDQGLTPGPAVLLLEIRGRARVATKAVIPARDVLQLDLTAARGSR